MKEEKPYNLFEEIKRAEALNEEAAVLISQIKTTSDTYKKKEMLDNLYQNKFNCYLIHAGIRDELKKSLEDMPEEFREGVKAGLDAEEMLLVQLQDDLNKTASNTLNNRLQFQKN